MESSRRTTWSPHIVICIIVLYLTFTVQSKDKCAPSNWQPGQFERRQLSDPNTSLYGSTTVSSSAEAQPTGNATISPVTISPLISTGDTDAGQVNCRYAASTNGRDVNYYTCTLLANRYGISVESFFKLNPGLHLDCSNIQADTDYCVRGFIEPVRATDGLCGPSNNNATCLGTEFQCCNANTFTCGNSTEDCAPGTCYEGACAGDSIYTTTGQCGRDYGYRLCAGVWGDCCNADGKCGTGESFCAFGVCQLGNCTMPPIIPSLPSWLNGNTTDGTCGGTNSLTCNVVYGNCCNKDGKCGALPSDCGAGCQSQWGTCSFSSTTSKTSSSSSMVTTSGPITTSGFTSSSSTIKTSSPTTTTSSSLPPSTSIPGEAALPSCGQLCFNNMLSQYSGLGCAALDAYCLCSKVDFRNGLRDCSNGACGADVASTVIAFGSAYCVSASATHTPTATPTGVATLPPCGQTCFNNMLGQYSTLGCAAPDAYCLCSKIDFSNGLRDCSNGACGTAIASTVIAYGSSYCASATASPTQTACKTVSGLATPKPSGAICGSKGTSLAMAGAGTLIAYSAGSSYVASLATCSAQCLATSCCTNIYFIQGKNCNLHYGPNALNNKVGNPLYDYYDATCFTCGALSCAA